MNKEDIIIVDQEDNCIGYRDKMIVHQNGILHRAFSVLIFDGRGKILLQRRSKYKYHSPLLWSNACCSHQRSDEALEKAVFRRLGEELGIHDISLSEIFIIKYRVQFDNSLIENEIDHVFVGEYYGDVTKYDVEEIDQVAWVNYDCLKKDILSSNEYTSWLKLILYKLIEIGFAI
jgi:isopentenyl-diphosphate Delta-isomerase